MYSRCATKHMVTMIKWNATDLISLAKCMRGVTSLLGMSILCTEMTHAETGTLFNVMRPSFTPSTPFDPGTMTASNKIISNGDLFFMGPSVWCEVVVSDFGIEATIRVGIRETSCTVMKTGLFDLEFPSCFHYTMSTLTYFLLEGSVLIDLGL